MTNSTPNSTSLYLGLNVKELPQSDVTSSKENILRCYVLFLGWYVGLFTKTNSQNLDLFLFLVLLLILYFLRF